MAILCHDQFPRPAEEQGLPALGAAAGAKRAGAARVVGAAAAAAAAPPVDPAVAQHLAQADEVTARLQALQTPAAMAQLKFMARVSRAIVEAGALE